MSTLRANTLSNQAGSQSIAVDRVAQATPFAWVNFNGTGTVAIRAQYNVSSITDNGTGNYTVNFTTAAPDANYAFTFGQGFDNVTATSAPSRVVSQDIAAAPTTTAFRMLSMAQGSGGVALDFGQLCVAFFR